MRYAVNAHCCSGFSGLGPAHGLSGLPQIGGSAWAAGAAPIKPYIAAEAAIASPAAAGWMRPISSSSCTRPGSAALHSDNTRGQLFTDRVSRLRGGLLSRGLLSRGLFRRSLLGDRLFRRRLAVARPRLDAGLQLGQ